jgi:hypothetical protein
MVILVMTVVAVVVSTMMQTSPSITTVFRHQHRRINKSANGIVNSSQLQRLHYHHRSGGGGDDGDDVGRDDAIGPPRTFADHT